MSEEIKIANKPYFITCSQPYTLGKNQPYMVNKFLDGKKSKKITEKFENKEIADAFYEEKNNTWSIDLTDLEGEIVDTITFGDEDLANEYYRKNLIDNRSILKSQEDESDEELLAELENNFNIPKEQAQKIIDQSNCTSHPSCVNVDEDGNIIDEEEQAEKALEKAKRKKEVAEAEEIYDNSAKGAMELAKDLLSSVAELYIDQKIIDKYPYIKKRLFFEEQSISNITLQIIISNKVLKKFYKEIIKYPSAKNIETLSKLQKTILDISRYHREYLGEIEKSFKQLKSDYDAGSFVSNAIDTEIEEITETDDGIITTNSRQRLIEELRLIDKESKIMKIPLSPNRNLQTNDEILESEALINERTDFDEDEDDEYKVEGNGFESCINN